jgi:hypothetical protein
MWGRRRAADVAASDQCVCEDKTQHRPVELPHTAAGHERGWWPKSDSLWAARGYVARAAADHHSSRFLHGYPFFLYSWAGVNTLSGLFAFCVIYGFVASAVAGLFPPACASQTTDLKLIGARTGMCFAMVSFATLTGPPTGGAVIQINGGDYLYAQILGGSALMTGTLCLVAATFATAGGKQ